MREVSVRMLHFVIDVARAAGVDEGELTVGLPSLTTEDGGEPDWIDWHDFVEAIERLERLVGGADALSRALRAAASVAFPEVRAFAAIFVHPIPLFTFVMKRLMSTMYKHIEVVDLENLGDERVRWMRTIPEPFRASEVFHRASVTMTEIFPMHLDLPMAKIETVTLTPRTVEIVAVFPKVGPSVRGSRAISAAATGLAGQLDEVFARIADGLRTRESRTSTIASASPTAGASARDWASRLALSPRQRDVFALLVEGRANKDIAAALRCSERNVEFHVGRILRAARVTSRAELLVKVLGGGGVSGDGAA